MWRCWLKNLICKVAMESKIWPLKLDLKCPAHHLRCESLHCIMCNRIRMSKESSTVSSCTTSLQDENGQLIFNKLLFNHL